MRKVSIILLILFCTSASRAQGKNVYIHLKNGEVLTYRIDSLSKMTFIEQPLPKYSVMNLFTPAIIPSPYETHTSDVDSVTFGDTLQTSYFDLALLGAEKSYIYFLGRYPITGKGKVDSITFSQFENDTNVTSLSNYYWDSRVGSGGEHTIGDYPCAVWKDARVFCARPLKYFDLNSTYEAMQDSTVYPLIAGVILFLSQNQSGSKLLYVQSRYYKDVSLGHLFEYNTQTNAISSLIPDDSNVSSAEYYGTDSILYYSFGSYSDANTLPSDAGYYFLNLSTGTKTLLLHHISTLGPGEMVNGFDISSDRKKLLIPSTASDRAPIAVEYDLTSHVADTLPVNFKAGYDRLALWLRYSHDGSKILYSNYPLGSLSGVSDTSDISEVGIIDRATFSKQELNLNPTTEGDWINVFPGWSPDDQEIIYGSASISREPPGMVDYYKICILKSLK